MIDKFKVYKWYKSRIFPKIKDVRGATRLLIRLGEWSINSLPKYEGEPGSIFERGKWDNLIILDACRYDYFTEIAGDCEKRVSLGCRTKQYIQRTFGEGDFSDIVYVSATPQLYEKVFKDLSGRDIDDVFECVFNTYANKWDEEEGTVLPESVAEDAITAQKLYPENRKIIHFNQPHAPFIGSDMPTPRSFRKSTGEMKHLGGAEETSVSKAEKGQIEMEEMREAYKQNLEIVFKEAEKLAEKLEGKTIVTSDHGELLGEKGLTGHPPGELKAKQLREVPWYEL